MKLHLSTTLRGALLAAVAVVGVTLSAAATIDTTLTTTFGNCAQGTATSVTTVNALGSAEVPTTPASSLTALYVTGNPGGTVELKTGGQAGQVSDFLTPSTNVGNGAPWTLEMAYTNAGDVQGISGITLSVGLFNADGDWQTTGAKWTGDVTFTATVTAGGESATYTGLLFNGESGTHYGRGSEKFSVTLSGRELDLADASDFTVKLVLTETLGSGTFVGVQNMVYNVTAALPVIGDLVWAGTAGNTWNTTDANWTCDGATARYANGSSAEFNDSGTAGAVVLEGALAPENVMVVNSAGHDYAFTGTGSLTGGMQLTKDGEGTLTVSTANNYTGGTVLNGGTLVAGSATAFGSAGIQINGGELNLGGFSINNALSIAEGTDIVLRNGSLNTNFMVAGGSVDADGVYIQSQALSVADAVEVSFRNGRGSSSGAVAGGDGSTISLTGNSSVMFSGNTTTSNYGGAIHSDNNGSIILADNGSVTFSENTSKWGGGAIYAYGGTISLARNGSVTFSGNEASNGQGGAIYAGYGNSLSLADNGSVTFSGNSGYSSGALYGDSYSTISLAGNESVTFTANIGSNRGAVYGYANTISLTGNGSVTFSGNEAAYDGGAISGVYSTSTITLSGNGSVEFTGNHVASASSGGAIYAEGKLTLSNNQSVTFRGNYEQSGSGDSAAYRLRSIYMAGSALKLEAGEGQAITFYDTLYATKPSSGSLSVHYNEGYKGGDIVFSGKYAADDLAALKPGYTQQELANSLTTEVYANTLLYGGRLRVEDGAVYKGNGITVMRNGNGTLRLAGGTLVQAGYNVSLDFGTTLDLQDVNSITASTLNMDAGSTLSFTVGEMNQDAAALTLNGNFKQNGALSLQLAGDGTVDTGQEYALLRMADGATPSTWDMGQISISGMGATSGSLQWRDGTLYFTTSTECPELEAATWNGRQSMVWNTTDKDWMQDGFSYRYKAGVDVVFGDTGSGEVTLDGQFSPGAVLVQNSAGHDYAFTGEGGLAGEMQLTKEGEGTLALGTANSHTGGTVVNGGKLVVENAAALGSGNVTVNGASLRINTDMALPGTLNLNGGSVELADSVTVSVGDSFTVTGRAGTGPALSGALTVNQDGFLGTGTELTRIDHSIIKLSEGSSVRISNVVLGASSVLTDDPATVVAHNLVVEGVLGENVGEGAPLTIKSGSILRRLGEPSELIELDKDASAAVLVFNNLQNVRLAGDSLTIDISGMYKTLEEYSLTCDWLGISLGDGEHAAGVDENLAVDIMLQPGRKVRGYVGWGGTWVTIPEPGENVGMIYIPLLEVPEPATGTLGLLALAALCTRRRRK